MEQNYTLGRGKVHFARFKTGTRQPDGFRYIGNTPEFNLTIESETLDHFSSDEGIREKDDSVPLETTRTGSLTTDNINPQNVALFFFGEFLKLTQAAAAGLTETFVDVSKDRTYQIGLSDATPAGIRGLTISALKIGATPLVLGTDYTKDDDRGTFYLKEGVAAITDGTTDIIAEFDKRAVARERMISGSQPVEGALLYVANNPKGKNFDFYMPYIRVTPNGDFALKGDEWQSIPLNIEILKPGVGQAIYCDGIPYAA